MLISRISLPVLEIDRSGFQALQSHRVAHCLWKNGKNVLAHFLQSQVSQIFQIDIHPNATLGEGIMLDHGTGIVMGETAMVRSCHACTGIVIAIFSPWNHTTHCCFVIPFCSSIHLSNHRSFIALRLATTAASYIT